MNNKLLLKISDAMALGHTVSFKSEGFNQVSVRVTRRVDENTIKRADSWIPNDKDHVLNDDRVCQVIDFLIEKIK